MKSYQALNEFVEHWRDLPSFLVDARGNCTFRARVNYDSPKIRLSRSTIVQIRRGAPVDGKVHIDHEAAPLPELALLNFSPLQHQYEHAADKGALLIHGQSPRLGGDYTVTISPA